MVPPIMNSWTDIPFTTEITTEQWLQNSESTMTMSVCLLGSVPLFWATNVSPRLHLERMLVIPPTLFAWAMIAVIHVTITMAWSTGVYLQQWLCRSHYKGVAYWAHKRCAVINLSRCPTGTCLQVVDVHLAFCVTLLWYLKNVFLL